MAGLYPGGGGGAYNRNFTVFNEQNHKKNLENENKTLKKEVAELRQMVSDLVAGIGERDLNILEEITNLGDDGIVQGKQ